MDTNKPSKAFCDGYNAYFDGFNVDDVVKFYRSETVNAAEWVRGLTLAKSILSNKGTLIPK